MTTTTTPTHDVAMHEGCWFCNTPLCEDCPDVPTPQSELLRDASVVVCPGCATPVDPESFEATRPVDLNACLTCHGTGGVVIDIGPVPWELDYDVCPVCDGTGQRSAA